MTQCFGEDLAGYKSGKQIEPGTYTDIKEGVLSNRGLSHIFTEEELTSLLQDIGFDVIQRDWVRYMDRGNLVHQIICIAKKL